MVSEKDVFDALHELYRRVGTQSAMAKLADITQSTINAYLNKKADVGNMPISVFLKLFQNMKIDFFGETSGDLSNDCLRKQLLEIFDSLDINEKVRMVAMSAANFGEKIREETKK